MQCQDASSKTSLQSQDAGLEARVSAELDDRVLIPQQSQNAGLEARVQHHLNS